MSDTHMKLHAINVPKGDILIHSGDLTFRGNIPEIQTELEKLSKFDFKHKILVAGNHDWLFQKQPALAQQMCKDYGITYLEDSMVEIESLKIYGSPWQPFFHNWAFNLARGQELEKKWELIPEGIDILVTHGPPKLILDETIMGEHAGCRDLFLRVMKLKPKLHTFGHIHYRYGTKYYDGVQFINSSVCDESYRPVNKPYVVEIEDGKIKDIRNE